MVLTVCYEWTLCHSVLLCYIWKPTGNHSWWTLQIQRWFIALVFLHHVVVTCICHLINHTPTRRSKFHVRMWNVASLCNTRYCQFIMYCDTMLWHIFTVGWFTCLARIMCYVLVSVSLSVSLCLSVTGRCSAETAWQSMTFSGPKRTISGRHNACRHRIQMWHIHCSHEVPSWTW